MKYLFYIDDDTNLPHIYKHGVKDVEIFEFFQGIKYLEISRSDGSLEAFGRLSEGRYLQVAFRKHTDEIFIITAYDIEDKEIIHQLEGFYESN